MQIGVRCNLPNSHGEAQRWRICADIMERPSPPLARLNRLFQSDSLMLSHVVIFWIKPDAAPDAADTVLAGCHQYLKDLPGVAHFHAGKMVPSRRPVVDQSYQVALNVVFTDKAAEEAYQIHPTHLEFVEKIFKPLCERAVIYDFA